MHYIDTTAAVQQRFEKYLERMNAENKDTLHIGTMQELKNTNPQLLEDLLLGDSLTFDFHYDKFFNPIRLPIEIK